MSGVVAGVGDALAPATRSSLEAALGAALGSSSISPAPVSLHADCVLSRPGDPAEAQADSVAGSVAGVAGRAVAAAARPDFSGVRIHTGSGAAESAAAMNAHAYTVGEHIVFAAGRYDPANSDGRRLLAHELTHVLQVRVGRVRRRLAGRTQESLSDMTAITEESLSVSGVLLAKVFNRQAYEVGRYREENARQVDLQVRQAMTGQSFFAVVQTFMGVTPALVYLLAGFLIAAGAGVSAGTVVAFTTLQTRLLFPTVNLLRVSLDVQTSLALFGRIFDYLDLKPRIGRCRSRAHARHRVR